MTVLKEEFFHIIWEFDIFLKRSVYLKILQKLLNGDTIDTVGWCPYLVVEYIVSFHKSNIIHKYNNIQIRSL